MKGVIVDCRTGQIKREDDGLPPPERRPAAKPGRLDIVSVNDSLKEIDAKVNNISSKLPELKSPPRSGHPAQLVSVDTTKARPARVKRIYNGVEYHYDCLVTENIIDQWQAGNIVVGDFVFVEFISEDEDVGGGEQIIVAKVRKTW